MTRPAPISELRTHVVENQPPTLEPYDPWGGDVALREAVTREGAGWATERIEALAAVVGSEHVVALGRDANRFAPQLRPFDRFGHRIDEVEFHPSYHELMGLAIGHALPSIAWTERRAGGHVAHAAL